MRYSRQNLKAMVRSSNESRPDFLASFTSVFWVFKRMPASYIRLLPLLEEFELVQVAALSAWYEKRPSIPENTINGYVQFVLVQKANDIDDQKELPVVAVVGSNYYQGPAVKTDCVLPYARHFYNEQVVDRKLKEEMRGPLDFALSTADDVALSGFLRGRNPSLFHRARRIDCRKRPRRLCLAQSRQSRG